MALFIVEQIRFHTDSTLIELRECNGHECKLVDFYFRVVIRRTNKHSLMELVTRISILKN